MIDDNSLSNAPAQAVLSAFERIAPQAAHIVKPYIFSLFHALESGHSFIHVSPKEAAQLALATPLVATHGNAPLLLLGSRLFLGKYAYLEQNLSREINRLSAQTLPLPDQDTVEKLHQWFAEPNSRDQQAAAALALISPFILISGGPGTGKTTTVAKLLALLCHDPQKLPEIVLAAPTGKAAARMTESLKFAITKIPNLNQYVAAHLNQLNAQTVHRLLRLQPPQMQSDFHREKPIHADILLLDEASMLDIYLLNQLFNALPPACRVILLGDANQLPSVGAGAALSAFQHSPPLNEAQRAQWQHLLPDREYPDTLSTAHARLTISHRFHQNSGIGHLAQAVLNGNFMRAQDSFARFPNELQCAQTSHQELAQQLFRQHQSSYWTHIHAGNIGEAFAAFSRLMVLTATREDAESINEYYRQIATQHTESTQDYFHGQAIMISRNDYTQKLYNGDIGIVYRHEGQWLAAFMEGEKPRYLPLNRLPEWEGAFAMTVHKSQGSEYDAIDFVAPQNPQNLHRALLYTAITRAKQRFSYWGDEESLRHACEHQESRRTALADFLYGKLNLQAA